PQWAPRPPQSIITLSEGKDSAASDARSSALWIDRIHDQSGFCVWGGSCEIAQAIWKVRATRAAVEQFLGKLRLSRIATQDATTNWLLENFPNFVRQPFSENYMGMFWVSSDARTKPLRTWHG
ncbi:MAG: hypothetical protein IPI01_20650, partial [Ignavibacteriae bacterium]|nr:hypothetical protein [Ignavibacteriota bacterium]